jgi:hypothetical protein
MRCKLVVKVLKSTHGYGDETFLKKRKKHRLKKAPFLCLFAKNWVK